MPNTVVTDTGRTLPLELRVGVTGHVDLDEQDPALLEAVAGHVRELARVDAARSQVWTPTGLTVVSALAEGADRIVARAVLAAGGRLEAVLPLPVEDYLDDFGGPPSVVEFHGLLQQAANVTVLPASESRVASYERVGRIVVQRSDVLLALWDGAPARGPGGTAEVVARARARGVPVRVVTVSRASSGGPTAAAGPGPSTGPASAEPSVPAPELVTAFERFNHWAAGHPAPADDTADPLTSTSPFEAYCATYARTADTAALGAQRRFRTITRLQYGLSVFAVTVIACQIVFRLDRRLVWLEFAALAFLVAGLLVARRTRPLERWLSFRYLAERLRSLPFLEVAGIADPLDSAGDIDPDSDPAGEWVRRAVLEIWCHRPPPGAGTVDLAGVKAHIVTHWVAPQVAYHQGVADLAGRRQRRFGRVGVLLFGLSATAALVHSAGLLEETFLPRGATMVSLVVPALGAALAGYAAQRDYARQARTSRVMLAALRGALAEVEECADQLALQRTVLRIQQRMVGDSADWYRATSLHEIELAG